MRLRKQRTQENPIQVQPEKKERPRLRKVVAWIVCGFLLFVIGIMVFASLFPATGILKVPGQAVADTVAPVQNIFSAVTNAVVNYMRTLKLRSNLEYEYNRVKAENEQLTYQAMRVDELEAMLAASENLDPEISANSAMNPITCTVIGRDTGNYFSVFDINKGSSDGITDYMAVTTDGALVGYTYNVTANRAKVRSIIDSQASIPGLIQTSRDQGMVTGTLGIDGQPMCRMFYLPDNLPRPGDTVVTSGVGNEVSFPKGIPIGTVRESTRRLDANKQYIVVEPKVDFQHIEYVIVLRYKPSGEEIEKREDKSAVNDIVPLDTQRPLPDLEIAGEVIHMGTPTPTLDPNATPTPSPTPPPTPTMAAIQTPPPEGNGLEYQVPEGVAEVTTAPPPTNPPTPSPTPTFSLDQLTVEGD
jgi:rod shape-determining protein MreC